MTKVVKNAKSKTGIANPYAPVARYVSYKVETYTRSFTVNTVAYKLFNRVTGNVWIGSEETAIYFNGGDVLPLAYHPVKADFDIFQLTQSEASSIVDDLPIARRDFKLLPAEKIKVDTRAIQIEALPFDISIIYDTIEIPKASNNPYIICNAREILVDGTPLAQMKDVLSPMYRQFLQTMTEIGPCFKEDYEHEIKDIADYLTLDKWEEYQSRKAESNKAIQS